MSDFESGFREPLDQPDQAGYGELPCHDTPDPQFDFAPGAYEQDGSGPGDEEVGDLAAEYLRDLGDTPANPMAAAEYQHAEVAQVFSPKTAIEDTERPPKLPQYVYVGEAVPPGFAEWYETKTAAERSVPMPGSSLATPEEKDFVEESNLIIVEMGDEAGADMRDRVQPLHEHNFYDTKGAYVLGTKMRFGPRMAGRYVDSQGFMHPSTGLVWTRSDDPRHDRYGMLHEKIHGVSVTHIEPGVLPYTRDGRTQYMARSVKVGYQDLPTQPIDGPHGMTEWVTDMAACKGMQKAGLGPICPNYRPLDILGGWVVMETAAEVGHKPYDIENYLIKGLWTPDRSGVEMMRDRFDNSGVDRLVNLGAWMNCRMAIDIAVELDMPDAVDDLRAYDRGEFDTYFNWRRPR
ncbi:MAG TPA: hypothetical protein VF809_01545 [Candidatus Saccharimonadales bacterium]